MTDVSPEQWLEEVKLGFRERVRFGIRSSAERYSAAWLTTDTESGFYIGARSVMGTIKISLHKSGGCRLAFEKDFAVNRGLSGSGEDRALVKWWRSPTPTIGTVVVVVLVFPTDFLHLHQPAFTNKKPWIPIPAAPAGKAVEILFCYSREPMNTLEPKLLQFGTPLAWTDLKNGDTVWMVSREIDFDATAFPSDETLNNLKGRLVDPEGFSKAAAERRSLTVHLWNIPKDNAALVITEVGGIATSGDVIPWLSSLFHAARTET